MKIVGGIFLLVSLSLILILGIATLQAQTDIGDTIINESSDSYEEYSALKNTTSSSMQYAGYSIWIVLVFVFAILAIMIAAAVYGMSKM